MRAGPSNRAHAGEASGAVRQDEVNIERLTTRAPLDGTILQNKVRLGQYAPYEVNLFSGLAQMSWEVDLFGGIRRQVQAAGADPRQQPGPTRAESGCCGDGLHLTLQSAGRRMAGTALRPLGSPSAYGKASRIADDSGSFVGYGIDSDKRIFKECKKDSESFVTSRAQTLQSLVGP